MTGSRISARLKLVAAACGALAMAACASAPAPAPVYRAPAASIRPELPQVQAPVAPFDLAALPFDESSAPVVDYESAPSECVPFARAASGVQIFGDAVTWWAQADGKYPRSSHPAEGSVFVMRGYNDDKRGHVAVVRQVVSDRMIRIDQANWLHAGEISYNVPVIDVSPDNSWSEVRVWYVPDNHWGGRVYLADGFIHPYPLGRVS
jgi:hypothetical protein